MLLIEITNAATASLRSQICRAPVQRWPHCRPRAAQFEACACSSCSRCYRLRRSVQMKTRAARGNTVCRSAAAAPSASSAGLRAQKHISARTRPPPRASKATPSADLKWPSSPSPRRPGRRLQLGGGGAPAPAVDATADIGVDPGPIEPTGPFWEDQEGLARRRAVEIKHGRIAMMAFIGMIVEELGHLPGSINLDGSVQFADILKDGMGFPAISNIPVFGLSVHKSNCQR